MAATEVSSGGDVRESARGWHQIQLAVLGFVGLCGVLQHGRPENPTWLQTLAAVLILGALITALAAIFIVGRIAWPPAGRAARPASQLRTGILLTFVAVAMLALATASMWWPQTHAAGSKLQLEAADGRAWCGRLADAPAGAVGVETDKGTVVLRLADVAALRPVVSCG
jgi:hypothetical protein